MLAAGSGELLVLAELLAFQQLDSLLLRLDVKLEIIDPATQDSQVLIKHDATVALLLVFLFPLLDGTLVLFHFGPPFLFDLMDLAFILLH